MLSPVLTLLLVIVVFSTFAYLLATPAGAGASAPSAAAPGPAGALVESMQLIVPEGEARMRSVASHVALIGRVVEGIRKDKIACIVPTKEEVSRAGADWKIVLPDSAAFGGGDAVLTPGNVIRQKNPLLEIVKEKERKIHELLSAVQLDLDVRGDQFKTRFLKKSMLLKEEIDQAKHDVVSGCSRQKIRLRQSHPHLSNYEFLSENVNNATSAPPASYVHGRSLAPVSRDDAGHDPTRGALGLLYESYSV